MRVAYIAGPYRAYKKDGGLNMSEVFENIYCARAVAKRYWALGYAVICPHTNAMFMDDDSPDEQWLEGDLEILKRCDVIVMMCGFSKSKGAMAELEFAKENGLDVIFD